MEKIVVLSGAGVSAESGLSTFRDNGGLWDKFPIEEVATIDAWNKNPEKVTEFYNLRRENCINVLPNNAHKLIADLENKYSVNIVTQNIDDLHERAGSTKVLHLHGEINLARSWGSGNKYPIPKGVNLSYGDKCPNGYLLRPDVVWFGEEVPNLIPASKIVADADILIIIGTSLQVYPAASLKDYSKKSSKKYLVDPDNKLEIAGIESIVLSATKGMKLLHKKLMLNN